jgi:hypothetical protein
MRFVQDWSEKIVSTNQNLLLEKIKDRTFPIRELDNGRPYRLLTFLLEDESLGIVQPPTYGFKTVDSFLANGVKGLPMELHWTLAVLISDVIRWVWQHQEPQGEGVGAIERIADLPIRIPIPFYRDRMWSLVHRIADAEGDQPLKLELEADLNDLVFSTFGFSDYEVNELESTLR